MVEVSGKTDFRFLREELFWQSNLHTNRIGCITKFSKRLFFLRTLSIPEASSDRIVIKSTLFYACPFKNRAVIKSKERTAVAARGVTCWAWNDWLVMSQKPHGRGWVQIMTDDDGNLIMQESWEVSDIYVFWRVANALKYLIAVLQMSLFFP